MSGPEGRYKFDGWFHTGGITHLLCDRVPPAVTLKAAYTYVRRYSTFKMQPHKAPDAQLARYLAWVAAWEHVLEETINGKRNTND